MFKVRGSILRGIKGNVSFTVIIFLFKHSTYFLITTRMYVCDIFLICSISKVINLFGIHRMQINSIKFKALSMMG